MALLSISFSHLHFNRRSQSDAADHASQRRIEIAELISPEIFSHMGIANINCMHENAPQAINQNDHEAVGLTRILLPSAFFFISRKSGETERRKFIGKSKLLCQMRIVHNYNVIVAFCKCGIYNNKYCSKKNEDQNIFARSKRILSLRFDD